MRGIFVIGAMCATMLLGGCASSPVEVSTKDVNASVLKNSLVANGSLNADFKARYAKLTPGMSRKAAFAAIGIPEDGSQTRLSSEDMRRVLYGDPKMESFEEAEKLRKHVSSLCGMSIPLESSKRGMYFTSPLFIGTTLTGYRVWVDMIFRCDQDELYFAEWRGSERLELEEQTAIWLLVTGAVGVPTPGATSNGPSR